MISLNEIFDSYGRKARLFPAFLAALPLLALVGTYTNLLEPGPEHIIWAVVAAAAMYLLADTARRLGKKLEKELVAEWGGYPSKILLRHSDTTVDPHTTDRYHRKAEALMDGFLMPTVSEEQADLVEADSRYESAVRYLLANTRDTSKFGLLLKENTIYGFRRNLFALKPIALILLVCCSIVPIYFAFDEVSAGRLPEQTEIALFVLFAGTLGLWTSLVTRASVREAADEYARQLLTSFDAL